MSVTSDVSDLHAYGCGDKISSVRCYNETRIRLYVDKNYEGQSWTVGTTSTFHTEAFGVLGDRASSARIVEQ